MMAMSPLVSVCMVSYNQEKYIRTAVESVLRQKTSFPFEIIISDDCSSDNTVNILYELKSSCDNEITILIGAQNIGYPNNQRRSLEAARGKYIALCDGDDYWTDSYKLQKQIDYLESNDDCAICFHNVVNIYEDNLTPRSLLNPLDFPSDLNCSDLILKKWFLATNSEVFRAKYLFFPDWYDSVLHIDYVLNVLVARNGRIHYMPDVMSVYRHNAGSVSNKYANGKYGYLLFHSQTMKKILLNVKKLLPEYLWKDVEYKIRCYEEEEKTYSREVYYEKHKILNLLRIKTYKRFFRSLLIRCIS